MNRITKFLSLFLLLMIPAIGFALPTITQVKVTNATCRGNGQLEIITSGTEAPVRYALIEPSTVTSPVQESNLFTGLPEGSYTVAVYDKTTGASPVTQVASIVSTYPAFFLNPPSASYNSAENCLDNGTLNVSYTGGRSLYNIKITNTTTGATWTQQTSSTSYTFTQLSSGAYHAEVTDNCGEYRSTVNTTTVTSTSGNLGSTPFTSLSVATAPTFSGNGACNKIYGSFYYGNFRINGASTIPSTYYRSIQYRIQYPADTENYTDWTTAYSYAYMYINNYDPTSLNYKVQVKHPCTGAITTDPTTYQLPVATVNYTASNYGVTKYNSFCTMPDKATVQVYVSSSGISSYTCGEYPFTVTFTPTAGTGTTTKTFTWSSGTYYYASDLDVATTYNVKIVDKNNLVLSENKISLTTVNPTKPLTLTPYAEDLYYYKCDPFNKFGIRISSTQEFTSYNGSTLSGTATFSIISGPVTRSPMTLDFSSSVDYYLWDDLPYGSYQIQVNYSCGRTETVTINKTSGSFLSYTQTNITTADGTVCGKYNIIAQPQVVNSNNQTVYNYYTYAVLYRINADNTKTLVTYNYGTGNRTFTNVDGGNYYIEMKPYYNLYSASSYRWTDRTCTLDTKTVTLAAYNPPVVDIPLSGGITCEGQTTGNLTVTSTGDRPPYTYRMKDLGADDSQYTAWQSSNIFTGVAPAKYTVQVKDNCGSATTQELRVFNGTDQFLVIVGEIAPGVVCSGKSTVLSVLSIGPVVSYKWYKNNVEVPGQTGPTYTLNNTSTSDIASYTVKINNGFCDLTSSVAILDVVTSPDAPVLTATCNANGGKTFTVTSNESDIVAYNWYRDGVAISGATTATYSTTVKGSYYVTIRTSGGCTSYSSDTLKVVSDLMYWSINATDNNWNNPGNWATSAGVILNEIPDECTTVHIPGNTSVYPVLSASSVGKCKNIYYHFGAEVAKPQYLSYEKAYIQYNFGYYNGSTYVTDGDAFSATPLKRGQWYALSAPLKNMASGDFSVGGYPNMWQQGFKAELSESGDWEGVWESPSGNNALPLGQQYNAISVWGGEYLPGVIGEDDHKNLNALKGILEMPYFENSAVNTYHRIHEYNASTDQSKFWYYDWTVAGLPIDSTTTPGVITRGKANAYKFIFDGQLTSGNEYKLTVPAGTKLMIGNPVLSTLDFDKFYTANSANVESYYRLYVNNAWVVYDVNVGAAELNKNIASYQAFFIETKGTGNIDLVFPLNDVSISRNTAHQLKSTTVEDGVENVLYVKTEDKTGEGLVTLSFNEYISGNNVDQLFSPDYPEVPQLYALDSKTKNAVQYVSGESVDLGVKSTGTSNVSLSILNVENLNATGLSLLDKKLNKTVNMFYEDNKYEFVNDPSFQNRFVLKVEGLKAPTGVDEITGNNQVNIYTEGKILHVSATDNIAEIWVSSVQGIQILNAKNSGQHFNKTLHIASGVYIVMVKLDNGNTTVEKVIIK